MTDCVPANDLAVVLVTTPSPDVAADIARQLVEDKLAACVNIVPGIRSLYTWQGKLCDDAETLCIIKTRADLVPKLGARVQALHPYEVPEVLSLSGAQVNAAYRDWVLSQVLL